MRRGAARSLGCFASALRCLPAASVQTHGTLPPVSASLVGELCGRCEPRWAGAIRPMCSTAAPPAAKARGLSEAALQSIVKVFTVHSSPNYFMPWQNKPQRESTGASAPLHACRAAAAADACRRRLGRYCVGARSARRARHLDQRALRGGRELRHAAAPRELAQEHRLRGGGGPRGGPGAAALRRPAVLGRRAGGAAAAGRRAGAAGGCVGGGLPLRRRQPVHHARRGQPRGADAVRARRRASAGRAAGRSHQPGQLGAL